jgi:hypothetical protein
VAPRRAAGSASRACEAQRAARSRSVVEAALYKVEYNPTRVSSSAGRADRGPQPEELPRSDGESPVPVRSSESVSKRSRMGARGSEATGVSLCASWGGWPRGIRTDGLRCRLNCRELRVSRAGARSVAGSPMGRQTSECRVWGCVAVRVQSCLSSDTFGDRSGDARRRTQTTDLSPVAGARSSDRLRWSRW